ncbi:CASTOR/POLLUX-related putative ion channel [Marinospirillum perlucidum]|uniref:CASTOR/POLLUX-related putative ion channel n=1 Tax=Marinospirillum perlucidum TaxID=1982602 RepID=UPI000DF45D7D|nr:ion channel DMI1 [Marinospirillum perlucidum]
MLRLGLINRIKFFVERQFVKGASFQLLVVMLVIGLISLLGGALVAWSGNAFDSLSSAIWWAFLRLTDPGYLGDDQGSWIRFVSTLLTVSGYVVFLGALVAIMTRKLISIMENLERGLTPVDLKNHLVVLGWTNRTLPLIRELLDPSRRMQRFLQRNAARRLQLVVLSEAASAAQRLELTNEAGIGSRARQVILRAGTAIQSDALHRVACLDAAAVILPSHVQHPDSLVTADVETLKALLSIAAQGRLAAKPLPLMVAELQDIRKLPVARTAYPGPLEVIASDQMLSRLLVQNLLHPGLASIYNELLTLAEGNEIFIRSGDGFKGLTLAELAARCPRALVLGLLQPDAQGDFRVALLADRQTQIDPLDQVVFIARSYEATQPDEALVASPASAEQESPAFSIPLPWPPAAKASLRILVLGWNRRLPAFLEELSSYREQQFDLDLVSVLPPDLREEEIRTYLGAGVSELNNLTYRHYQADYMVEEELRRLDLRQFDSILLLSSDRLDSGEEADARALVGQLQLDSLLREEGHQPQVVMELNDPDNESLLNLPRTEVLVGPVILSHLLAQIALRRELKLVLDEIFTVGGAEIRFSEPLGKDAGELAWMTCQQQAEAKGTLALGIYRPYRDAEPRLLLNPGSNPDLYLHPGDQLILLMPGEDKA